MPTPDPNMLYFGDNLSILREHIPDESVDLIYLDPPFNSQATYNVLFAEKSGEKSAAQITAFEDTWHWGEESEHAFFDIITQGPAPVAKLLSALREFLGNNDMMAYLTMMAVRLVELHRILKPTGSLYLHCDPTAGHYLKMILDGIFGNQNYRNEIIWQRTSSHNDPKRFGRVHDVVLFYVRSSIAKWNAQYDKHDSDFFDAHDFDIDEQGKKYRKRDLTAPYRGGKSGQYEWKGKHPPKGRMWSYTQENMERLESDGRIVYTKTGMPRLKIYIEDLKGLPLQDVWANPELWLNSAARERLGYPTQKPLALLERIIQASSNEGDVILDPFCGCGTAIVAAERLQRRWIGIDITHLAIALMRHRLHDTFGESLAPYEVCGDPKDCASAHALALHDRYQFQWWAVGLVNARPAQDKRKGADHGVDGYLFFLDDNSGKPKSIVVQVKSGGVSVRDIRELDTVRRREKAEIGVFITLEPPTRPMGQEAGAIGFYEPRFFPGHRFPRLQILTIEELLAGKEVQYPRFAPTVTFKRAPRHDRSRETQTKLF